jgi:hypothetical protein
VSYVPLRSGPGSLPLVLLSIVTLATLVHAKLAVTAQFAMNQTADHQAATAAVSLIDSLSTFDSTTGSKATIGALGDGEIPRVNEVDRRGS